MNISKSKPYKTPPTWQSAHSTSRDIAEEDAAARTLARHVATSTGVPSAPSGSPTSKQAAQSPAEDISPYKAGADRTGGAQHGGREMVDELSARPSPPAPPPPRQSPEAAAVVRTSNAFSRQRRIFFGSAVSVVLVRYSASDRNSLDGSCRNIAVHVGVWMVPVFGRRARRLCKQPDSILGQVRVLYN